VPRRNCGSTRRYALCLEETEQVPLVRDQEQEKVKVALVRARAVVEDRAAPVRVKAEVRVAAWGRAVSACAWPATNERPIVREPPVLISNAPNAVKL
jgi:hypothetical protein